jgi:N-acetylglucosaminyl-diphospho-decaprenol L-rhamnosyltransferase
MSDKNLSCDVSIIIVSWNVADLLHTCLETVFASSLSFDEQTEVDYRAEVIVVDSASSDHTLDVVRDFPQVKLFAQDENVGFTRGNNIGFEQARGRYLFMLNPDTEVVGDAIAGMIAYMDAHAEVGILGPQTHNTDGSYQSTKRRFYNTRTLFTESTWLQSFAPKTWLDDFYAEDVAQDAIAPVDWVQGSALMARREVYEQIGGLDEGFVMYAEEMDWCTRAKNAGWQVVYWGAGIIVHHGGKSSEQIGAFKHIHFQTSKIRYCRKHHGQMMAHFLRAFLWLGYGWQYLIEASKALIGHKRAMRLERMRTYRQVLKSGLRHH